MDGAEIRDIHIGRCGRTEVKAIHPVGERIAFGDVGKGLIEAGVFAVEEEIFFEIRFDLGIAV
ncbi:hypothetical protein [Porphyrobacter sp. HT-58-2]|uniref:hypothetical protein n=1 Tax=Porphyrobacter sp. HT-58-2 TaxID=2023229 RepID=UPI0011B02FC6|nr:hypothetical protein [Porphyrobacter sp. HT-58-2]